MSKICSGDVLFWSSWEKVTHPLSLLCAYPSMTMSTRPQISQKRGGGFFVSALPKLSGRGSSSSSIIINHSCPLIDCMFTQILKLTASGIFFALLWGRVPFASDGAFQRPKWPGASHIVQLEATFQVLVNTFISTVPGSGTG